MKNYSKAMRGMMFWFDPSKAYGQTNRFFDKNDTSIPSHIQNYNRPWLVVSNNLFNFSSNTVTMIPSTSEEKPKMPWHIKFSCEGKVSTLLIEQMRTVDIDALGDFYICLSDDMMRRVSKAIKLFLGIGGDHHMMRLSYDEESSDRKQNLNTETEEFLDLDSTPSLDNSLDEENNNSNTVETKINSKYVKDYTGMSQIEKFNARYGIPTKVEVPVSQGIDDKPTVKSAHMKWDKEKCITFLEYANTHTVEETLKEWNISNRKKLSQRKYYCKKILENNP